MCVRVCDAFTVAREIIWRRPTAKKIAKDLDDVAECTQVGGRRFLCV